MIRRIKWFLVFFVWFLCLFFFLLFCSGCDSYKPVKGESLSDYPECIVMMNAGEIYKGDRDKSGTVSPVLECINSIRRQRCAMESFDKIKVVKGREIYVVDWGDKEGLNKFNECMNKK